jgi:uncharacterized protein
LSLHSTRSSIIARGRRDAANAASNPHYRQAVADYKADNFSEAAAGFRLAAEQGHADSQYLLSTMYDAGQGLPQDDTQAAYWERKAAEQGHAYAQANLSFRFYAADNFAEAFEWCQRAAHSNLAWAQYNLGLMYRKGEGISQSDTEAAHWYRLAATQNFPEAQVKLADLYYTGQGVPLNYTQAAAWYRKAADHGKAEAQFQLGHLFVILTLPGNNILNRLRIRLPDWHTGLLIGAIRKANLAVLNTSSWCSISSRNARLRFVDVGSSDLHLEWSAIAAEPIVTCQVARVRCVSALTSVAR